MDDPNAPGAPAPDPTAPAPAPGADPNGAQLGDPIAQPQPLAPADPAPADTGSDALVSAIVEGVLARLPLQAPQGLPGGAQPPTIQDATTDALQIGEALVTHKPLPQRQARALGLMALAAVVPGLAHAFHVAPDAVVPYLNAGAVALAFVASAIGDFTGLGRAPRS